MSDEGRLDDVGSFFAAKRFGFRDELLIALIERRVLSFTRTDGTVLSEGVKLLPDGSISGYSHPNEMGWAISGDGLIFTNEQGHPTTIFDKIERAADGALVLLGRFLGASSPGYHHRLTTGSASMSELASVVSTNAQPIQPSAPVAVLVRTHQCNAKYLNLMAKLDRGREGFDLYAIVDETRGRRDPGEWPAIWHSVQACSELGLTQKHPAVLLLCGDFPLYFALREIPRYQHYVMIEDDVELRDQDASFIVEMCKVLSDSRRPQVDFGGVLFQPDRGLIWGPASAKAYTQEYCYLARFPFVVVSKRLCAYLFSQRQVEAARHPPRDDLMHCEVFAPSAAMAGGFTCLDINELIPGCYDQSIMMLDVPGYGRPMGAVFRGGDRIRMFHPVYVEEEWLERMRRGFSFGSPQREDKLRRILAGLAREESLARETGDAVMASAIAKFSDRLGPKWQEFFVPNPTIPSIDFPPRNG